MHKQQPTPTANNPDTDGCTCDTGPVVVATFTDGELAGVSIEHWTYCPVPNVRLDDVAYRKTGAKIPA